MLYKITAIVHETTKTGLPISRATILAADGTITDGVTIWPKSWQTDPKWPFQVNQQVEGELKVEAKGNFTNKTLYPPFKKVEKNYAKPYAVKSEQIQVAQERKAEFIEKAQDRKEESIAWFNSTNAAIEVCAKLIDFLDDDGKNFAIEQSIVHWRNWFLEEYKKYSEKKNLPF